MHCASAGVCYTENSVNVSYGAASNEAAPFFVLKMRDIYAGYDTISASTSARLVPEKA